MRRRSAGRRAEQLLTEPETLAWERALMRLVAEAPDISRDWRPAPQAMAHLAGEAVREWEREARPAPESE
ncbi:hypothetical protein [Streptomyces sp. NBC_01205]|uniref:hypothetical protein n=1 Tax=Streptomyces sp. NBC_01205 TaxID=2903771 RepID=UPI002E15E593|nr:hypothetical protein OG573_43310 [Streptomyces sp. NBC_01205]